MGTARGRTYEDLNKQTPVALPANSEYVDTTACAYDTSTVTASCVFEDFGSFYADTADIGSFYSLTVGERSGNSLLSFSSSATAIAGASVVSFGGKNNVLKILLGTAEAGILDLISQLRIDVGLQTILKDANDDYIAFDTIAYPDFAHVIDVEFFFDLNPTDSAFNNGTYNNPRNKTVYMIGGSAFHCLGRQHHTSVLDDKVGEWNKISLVVCDQFASESPTVRQLEGSGTGGSSPARSYILPVSVQFDDTVSYPSESFGPAAVYIASYTHYVYPRT